MAGSWFGESLTENLAQRAWQEFNSIEQRGGMVAAIADGWVHARTESAAAALIGDIECLRQPIIGVSLHPPTEADEGGTTFVPEPRDRARGQTNAEPGAAGSGTGAWPDGAVEDWQSGRAGAGPGLPASTSPPLRALRRSLPFEQLWLAAEQQRAKGQGAAGFAGLPRHGHRQCSASACRQRPVGGCRHRGRLRLFLRSGGQTEHRAAESRRSLRRSR